MFILFKKWFTNSHKSHVKILNALSITLILNFLFGLGFYLIESPHQEGLTLLDSIWWAMVTMTTVGYGDYFPVTTAGRFLIAYPCFIIGIGFIGFLFGVIVDSVLDQITQKKKGYAKMNLTNHSIICQCPSEEKILKVVKELRASGETQYRHIVVIDNSLDEQPLSFKENDIRFIKGNPSSEKILSRAALPRAQSILVLARDTSNSKSDAETFAIGTVIKMLTSKNPSTSPDPKLVLELVDRNNLNLLQKVNSDGIVPTSGISEQLLVQELCNPGIAAIFDQLVSYHSGFELYLLPTSSTGKSLNELKIASIQHKAELQVLGLLRKNETHFCPSEDINLHPEDRLIVLARSMNDFYDFERSITST